MCVCVLNMVGNRDSAAVTIYYVSVAGAAAALTAQAQLNSAISKHLQTVLGIPRV